MIALGPPRGRREKGPDFAVMGTPLRARCGEGSWQIAGQIVERAVIDAGNDPERWMTVVQAKPWHKRLRREFGVKRRAHQQRVGVVESAAPIVVSNGLKKCGVVSRQFGVE